MRSVLIALLSLAATVGNSQIVRGACDVELYVSSDFGHEVVRYDGTTGAFLEAFSAGAADFNAALVDKSAGDGEAMVKLIHKYVYADRPYEKAARPIRAGAMRISPGAALNADSIADQLAWFQSEGLVDADITLDLLLDRSYVEAR